MSTNGMLYIKGIDRSGSEDEEDLDDNVWDDRKLNDAYDKALKIANAEVAKRIAMSTNTVSKDKPGVSKIIKDKPKQSSSKVSKKDMHASKWKVGMHCRAIYDEDGIEYEATVQKILKGQECVIQFLGYENEQVVSLASLRPSLGKEVRMRQVVQSIQDETDDECIGPVPENMDLGSSKGGKSPTVENIEGDIDRAPSPTSNTDRSINRGPKFPKKKKKKNQNQRQMNGFNLPDMGMPNFNMLMNGSNDMPLPPPPPLGFPGTINVDSEDQAVSSMLLSWYMSGYYTGLYQGLKRARENRRNH